MESLFQKQHQKLNYISLDFKRSLMDKINWNARMIGIKGPRGVGKTTLLLQHIKSNHFNHIESVLYVSLDNMWFNKHNLIDLVEEFVQKGGKHLYLDEVHRYKNWSLMLKNIYDDYPQLQVVFTGSSALEIINASADLSRRAVIYDLQGLSFREFLVLETQIQFPILSLNDILFNHIKLSHEIIAKLKPLHYFERYLKNGYYPFFKEEKDLYFNRLEGIVNMILEIELPSLRQVEIAYINKIKELLLILAESVPFIPNISKLSDKININRVTLLSYLHYLNEISLTKNLYKNSVGISRLQKPNKMYLDNPNLMYLFDTVVNNGTLRETFFANQLSFTHQIYYSDETDFYVDNQYLFEIGGKSKSYKQIKNKENAFIAADDIEFGFENKIPLWLFGFLY